LFAITEILDSSDLDSALQYADIIQIGSRNMMNYALLKEVGKLDFPVILKRGMMSSYEEFMYAAEYIVSHGNDKLILCERGIRTYCTHVRNMLDISAIALIKQDTSMPVIVDLSHSLGRKDIIGTVQKAVMAIGVDGIMVELHPNPEQALSDVDKQLDLDEFESFMNVFHNN